jgi:hypothetical protein
MTKIAGLWVHQGVPQAAIAWERAIEDAREERIESALPKS